METTIAVTGVRQPLEAFDVRVRGSTLLIAARAATNTGWTWPPFVLRRVILIEKFLRWSRPAWLTSRTVPPSITLTSTITFTFDTMSSLTRARNKLRTILMTATGTIDTMTSGRLRRPNRIVTIRHIRKTVTVKINITLTTNLRRRLRLLVVVMSQLVGVLKLPTSPRILWPMVLRLPFLTLVETETKCLLLRRETLPGALISPNLTKEDNVPLFRVAGIPKLRRLDSELAPLVYPKVSGIPLLPTDTLLIGTLTNVRLTNRSTRSRAKFVALTVLLPNIIIRLLDACLTEPAILMTLLTPLSLLEKLLASPRRLVKLLFATPIRIGDLLLVDTVSRIPPIGRELDRS